MYIGAFVGAGFAGGKEIKLYFGSSDVLTLLVSSVASGALCFLFLAVGGKGRIPPILDNTLSFVFAISGIVVSGIMLAGLNELTGSALSSLLTALLCLGCLFIKDGVGKLCVVAVPLIIVVLVVVSIKTEGGISGTFTPINAFAYAGMNMFFEFGLMREEGKRLTFKDDFFVSVLVSVITFVLLFAMRYVVENAASSLPFFEAASAVGAGFYASLTMFMAVASTVAGCFSLSKISSSLLPSGIGELILVTVSLTIATFDFEKMVETVYPVVSVLGLILSLFAVVSLLPFQKINTKYLRIFNNNRKNGIKKKKIRY